MYKLNKSEENKHTYPKRNQRNIDKIFEGVFLFNVFINYKHIELLPFVNILF